MYWNNDTTRHVTSSNNPVRRGIERAGDLHRVAMSDEEIDHTISPSVMMPDVGEDHAEPTIEMEYPDDDGYADARAASRRTAGFQPQNWREYPGGTGNEFQNADGDWVDVQADYFDALYPEENPSAIWDGSYVYVFDSTGEVILNKEAYDFQEAQQVANKALEKAYKGEAKPEQGQGMFFRTPGKGKLFSSREGFRKGAPFADYDDFEDCQQQNSDKGDPDAYCGEIKHRTEDKESRRRAASDEDEPKRKRQPGGQAANWGAGQLTPQRIQDEMAQGQNVDFGGFGAEASRTAGLPHEVANLVAEAKQSESPESDYAIVEALALISPTGDHRVDRLIEEAKVSETAESDYTLVQALTMLSSRHTASRRTAMPGAGMKRRGPGEWEYRGCYLSQNHDNEDYDGWWEVTDIDDPTGGGDYFRTLDQAKAAIDADPPAGYTASRKQAWSLLDQVNTAPLHRVAGWDWDHQIEGYVSDGVADFACVCGSNVEAPGHVVCECGKMWNSYQIQASDGVRLVCREVPVRENVLLANRERRR